MSRSPRRADLPREVHLLIDPETREAHRQSDAAGATGPVFFTTRQRALDYAEERGLPEYQVYTVPGGVLSRMRGKLHWVNDERRG